MNDEDRLAAIEARLDSLVAIKQSPTDPLISSRISQLESRFDSVEHSIRGLHAGFRERARPPAGISKEWVKQHVGMSTKMWGEAQASVTGEKLADVARRIDNSVAATASNSARALEALTTHVRQSETLVQSLSYADAHAADGAVLGKLAQSAKVQLTTLDLIDAKFASIKTRGAWTPPNDDVGAVILAAVSYERIDPMGERRNVVRSVEQAFRHAEKLGDEARSRGALWIDIARCLRDGTPPPAAADTLLAAAVRSIQSGAQLGMSMNTKSNGKSGIPEQVI